MHFRGELYNLKKKKKQNNTTYRQLNTCNRNIGFSETKNSAYEHFVDWTTTNRNHVKRSTEVISSFPKENKRWCSEMIYLTLSYVISSDKYIVL
ncbi:unnamed protein product [Bubo scandiacus]